MGSLLAKQHPTKMMLVPGGAVSEGSSNSSGPSSNDSHSISPRPCGEPQPLLGWCKHHHHHQSPPSTTPSGGVLLRKKKKKRLSRVVVVVVMLLPQLLLVLLLQIQEVLGKQPQPQHSTHHHHPERGQVLQHLTPHNMCDAYRAIQRDYQAKAFAPSAQQWQLLSQKDGVQVSLLHHPSDPNCPYVQMTGIIPASVQDCWNFLLVSAWDTTMPKMDPFYEGVTTYGEYQYRKVHMILCRKRTKRILAFGKRDLVFLSVQDEPLPDGTWVSGTVSVVTPRIPRQSGYTRAFQDSIAFYKPLQGNTKTQLTIVCRMDLNDSGTDGSGGHIPMWLYVKTIGYTGVQSVIRMRDAIVEDVQKRRDHQRQAAAAAASAHSGRGWNPFQFHRGWFHPAATPAETSPGPGAGK